MSPEEFIRQYTKGCSNETTQYGSYDHTYHEWLTPDQALKAVELARDEVKQNLADKVNKLIQSLETQNPDPLGKMSQLLAAAEIETLNVVLDIIKEV